MNNPITSLRIALLLLALLLLVCVLGTSQAVAQKSPRSNADESSRQSSPEQASETVEAAEAAALELVRRHLPQLTELLKTLRRDAPEQYRRAITDLARQARRLEVSRRRDPRLFDVELEILKRQTRVDLCVARLQLRDDPKTRVQLRRAIGDLQQARRARLEYERDQLQQRMARIEQQLQTVEERLEAPFVASPQWIDKAYRNLLRKAGRSAGPTTDSAGDATGVSADPSAGSSSAAAEKTDGNETETAGSPSR